MAFKNDMPYLLVREKKKLYVAKINSDDTLKFIREVPNKYWWFKIFQDKERNDVGLFIDDCSANSVAYPFIADKKGKCLSKSDNFYWHLTTSSCKKREYFIIEKCVFTYKEDNTLINLDENPDERFPEEQDAVFFVASSKGILIHKFSNKKGEWEYLVESEKFYNPKQITYDPLSKTLVAISNSYGLGWAHFIDMESGLKSYSNEAGFWSVTNFQGRFFFYKWGKVIEITKDGEEITHNINGEIARNQCLFSTSNALYFVCVDKIYRYKNNEWTIIDFSNQIKLS